jgi:DNA-binding transcriptional MerR regulator
MKNAIDKEQAAKLLDITVKTLELWVSEKYGPMPKRVGRLLTFDKAEVEAFAKKLKLKDTKAKPHSGIKKQK